MKDLFGVEVADELPKKTPPAGYAAQPGSGPKGETCRTCKHLARKVMSKTYLKCALMQARWTGGHKTDIRAKVPACRHWAEKEK